MDFREIMTLQDQDQNSNKSQGIGFMVYLERTENGMAFNEY